MDSLFPREGVLRSEVLWAPGLLSTTGSIQTEHAQGRRQNTEIPTRGPEVDENPAKEAQLQKVSVEQLTRQRWVKPGVGLKVREL